MSKNKRTPTEDGNPKPVFGPAAPPKGPTTARGRLCAKLGLTDPSNDQIFEDALATIHALEDAANGHNQEVDDE